MSLFGGPADAPPREAYRMVRDGALLLDVRERHEFSAGHAPGAVHLPLGQLAVSHGRLPRDQRIVTVCRSGNRSKTAARTLRKLGYDVVNLAGGMTAWQQAGLPVATASGARGQVA